MSYPEVFSRGPSPNLVLLLGESPSYYEYLSGKPFVGPSGEFLDNHLSRYNLSTHQWYVTNVNKTYLEGNSDPSYDLLLKWRNYLLSEISSVSPKLIICAGYYASSFFLGENITMGEIHGLCFRPKTPHSLSVCHPDTIIYPIYHPAYILHKSSDKSAKSDFINLLKKAVLDDYSRLPSIIKTIQSGGLPDIAEDLHQGKEIYEDVTGSDLDCILHFAFDINNKYPRPSSISSLDQLLSYPSISLDTEDYWSIQITPGDSPGTGYVLRGCQSDKHLAISTLQILANNGIRFILHDATTPQGTGYDLRVCRKYFNLDLSRAFLWNTMTGAYCLGMEQGLKGLATRLCGMHMEDYQSLISDITLERCLEYLDSIANREWENIPKVKVIENDGTIRLKGFQNIRLTAKKILRDYYCGKTNKNDEEVETDPVKRYKQLHPKVRRTIEKVMGPRPIGTLDDIPLERAKFYACRDSDATSRVSSVQEKLLDDRNQLDLCHRSCLLLPRFERMQSTGMPCSQSLTLAQLSRIEKERIEIGNRLSVIYFNGQPFNPNSDDQMRTLLKIRELEPQKLTPKKRLPSTSKKSIEHFRFVDPAMALAYDWREMIHNRDNFYSKMIQEPEDIQDDIQDDIVWLKYNIKTTRTTTRRLSTEGRKKRENKQDNPFDINILAIPSRTEEGRKVRDCFIAPPGYIFGGWDYSQIEARYLAHCSRDPILVKLFNDGRDIHRETAAMIFDIPIADMYAEPLSTKLKECRYAAKTINFGVFYGMSPRALQDNLRTKGILWTYQQCIDVHKNWFRIYRGVRDYIEYCVEISKKQGYVSDISGMRRDLPGIYSKVESEFEEAKRDAVSMTIQGGAQTIMQNAMIHLDRQLIDLYDRDGDDSPEILWPLQYHDENVLLFPEEEWDLVDSLVTNSMENHYYDYETGKGKLIVPVLVDGHQGKSWGELKG